MGNNEKRVKERVITGGYGKFDLLPTILDRQELLAEKPRILLQKIMETLDIPEDCINPGSFRVWLIRYRANTRFPGYAAPDTNSPVARAAAVTKVSDDVWDCVPKPPEFNNQDETASILIPVKKQN